MFMLLVLRAARAHAASGSVTLASLTCGGLLAGLPIWVPGLTWAVVALGGLELAPLLEPLALRVRGLRPATSEELLLLGQPTVAVYVQEDDALRLARGLRCLVVSRGALEVFEPHWLQALVIQAESASEPGRLLIRIGAAPILAFGQAGAAVTRLGDVLALAAGSALVFPLWAWPEGFVRVAGRVLGGVLVAILGCLLIASRLTVWGVGLLTGWALAHGLERLLAWEASRVELEADQATVDAGYGPALLAALELRRDLGEPLAPRISAVRAALSTPATRKEDPATV